MLSDFRSMCCCSGTKKIRTSSMFAHKTLMTSSFQRTQSTQLCASSAAKLFPSACTATRRSLATKILSGGFQSELHTSERKQLVCCSKAACCVSAVAMGSAPQMPSTSASTTAATTCKTLSTQRGGMTIRLLMWLGMTCVSLGQGNHCPSCAL